MRRLLVAAAPKAVAIAAVAITYGMRPPPPPPPRCATVVVSSDTGGGDDRAAVLDMLGHWHVLAPQALEEISRAGMDTEAGCVATLLQRRPDLIWPGAPDWACNNAAIARSTDFLRTDPIMRLCRDAGSNPAEGI